MIEFFEKQINYEKDKLKTAIRFLEADSVDKYSTSLRRLIIKKHSWIRFLATGKFSCV